MKITESNFEQLFPKVNTTFKTVTNGRFAPQKTMRQKNSHRLIRYLEPADIKYIAEKRLAADNGPNKENNRKKWEYMIQASNKLIKEEYEKVQSNSIL